MKKNLLEGREGWFWNSFSQSKNESLHPQWPEMFVCKHWVSYFCLEEKWDVTSTSELSITGEQAPGTLLFKGIGILNHCIEMFCLVLRTACETWILNAGFWILHFYIGYWVERLQNSYVIEAFAPCTGEYQT